MTDPLDTGPLTGFSPGLWIAAFALVPIFYLPYVYEGALLPKLLLLQIILLVVVLELLRGRAVLPPFSPVSLITGLAFYLLVSFASILQAGNRVETVLQLSQLASFVAIPILVHISLDGRRIHQVILAAAWTGLLITLIGIGQYHGLAFDSIPSNANPSATFYHRNTAAEYLIGILPFAWICFRRSSTRGAILAHAGLIAILGSYLLYTRTRGHGWGFQAPS